METYIYKMIALSAIFILLYFVFLEKEKNHVFKRFYLFTSILFSALIPLMSITYGSVLVEENVILPNQKMIIIPEKQLVESSIFTLENILLVIYFLGFLFFFAKFLFGLFQIYKTIRNSEKRKFNHYTIILNKNKITPHSFWDYIFLYKNDFLENKIDAKILQHEEAHVLQKHSLDVVFIEFLLCVFWFNPAFYFYKKAMITNHEFLADEAVLQKNQDVENYQKLILTELISEKILFTHPFNLNNTKKRIVMMTTKITKIAMLKSYLTLPISAILFFAFVEKIPAKVEVKNEKVSQNLAKKANPQSKEIKELGKEKNNLNKESLILKSDTIKPKKQKVEKIQPENTEMIPPPPPVPEITSQTEPEFPGGMNALRMKFSENFDMSKIDGSKKLIKGVINIIVSEDGKKYNAYYEFENENFKNAAQDAIEKSLKGVTWKPGTQNGKPVASQLKFPITMNFE